MAFYDERYTRLCALAKTRGTTNSKLEGKLKAEKTRTDVAEGSLKSLAKDLKKVQDELKKLRDSGRDHFADPGNSGKDYPGIT